MRLCFLLILSLAISRNTQCNNTQDIYRYTCIQSLLNQYKRPFTMLYIQVGQGMHSLKAAHDYNSSVFVMTESDKSFLDTCKSKDYLKNIILLNKLFTIEELQHLSECEHFDVVLALNVERDFGEQWQKALEVIFHLGDHIVIEISSQNIEIESYIIAQGGQVLGKVPSINQDNYSVLYVIEQANKYLHRKTWLRSIMEKNLYKIDSSFTNKTLLKPNAWPRNTFQYSLWAPGINLVTFKMCHGTYPTSNMLKKHLLCMNNTSHSDWLINNMIIQGDKLITIDGNDESCKAFFSEALLKAHQELLDLEDPQQVEHYFWQKLIKVSISRRQIIKFFSQFLSPSALMFDISSRNKFLINAYLGYGTKIVYADTDQKIILALHDEFKRDEFIVTENIINLDSMILQYGIPKFCAIHEPQGSIYEVLKTLSQPIACIAYKFDIRAQDDCIACLKYLCLLGYKEFNFSVRDVLGLALEPNKYIGTNKKWVHSIDELLFEINNFSELDHNSKELWGFIYAKI